jgi:MFS transporter, OFA family, oxalate/formate antiporter
MAQGVGSVLGGPLAAMLHDATGSWTPVFITVISMDFLTAVLALAVLKPMRQRFLADTKVNPVVRPGIAPAFE